jgi:hypothetical protein
MKISALYIYPVKSLGGISLTNSDVEERGLKYDRRWVLVDENNTFITQRKHPQMAFFDVAITPGGLRIHDRRTKDELTISFTAETSEIVRKLKFGTIRLKWCELVTPLMRGLQNSWGLLLAFSINLMIRFDLRKRNTT